MIGINLSANLVQVCRIPENQVVFVGVLVVFGQNTAATHKHFEFAKLQIVALSFHVRFVFEFEPRPRRQNIVVMIAFVRDRHNALSVGIAIPVLGLQHLVLALLALLGRRRLIQQHSFAGSVSHGISPFAQLGRRFLLTLLLRSSSSSFLATLTRFAFLNAWQQHCRRLAFRRRHLHRHCLLALPFGLRCRRCFAILALCCVLSVCSNLSIC
mmetsp:Transcript_56758/g.90407  ORF Transcript_56758/g.90407 Transcript_56758/m.90407 type:complete len:212 (-) Transcript_56758:1012-1647(-)